MTKTLKVVFDLEGGKTYTVSLADPKNGLTKTETQTWANEVISEEALVVGAATATGINSMYIHTVDDVELTD